MKDNFSFYKYFSLEEEENGDYWNYLNITLEEERKLNLDYLHQNIYFDVISQVKNKELKDKMLKKLKGLVNESLELDYRDLKLLFVLFSKEELINFIDKKISNLCLNWNSVSNLIDVILYMKMGISWKVEKIDGIFSQLNNSELLMKSLGYIKNNFSLYERMVEKYKDKLPNEYSVYFELRHNSRYIVEKKEEKLKDTKRIGIDPKILIGVEIEANGQYDFFDFLDNQDDVFFRRTLEPTVPDGVEVSTNKEFHDVLDDVAMLGAVCETMEQLGYYYDSRACNAAGQINLGIDYLDSARSLIVFYEIFCNCEELLWYISNGDRQIARQNIFTNSRMKPISEIIGTRVLDEDITRNEVIRLFCNELSYGQIKGLQYKKNTVCLRGKNDDSFRFEIRIPNGGCKEKIWVDNIRLYGKMMEVSKQVANIMVKKEDLTFDEERILNFKLELQDKGKSLEEKLDILMDLLFGDADVVKKIYYDRFINTKRAIVETGTNNYKNLNINNEPKFDEVNIDHKYRSFAKVISYDDGNFSFFDDTDIYGYDGNGRSR